MNRFRRNWPVLLATLLQALWLSNLACGGDQIVLRFYTDPQIASPVVKLKDIVEVVSGSSTSMDKLRELALGPAPRPGQVQTWNSSDVLKHLELRGIYSQSVRWTGNESARLHGVQSVAPDLQATLTPAFVDDRAAATAKSNVVAAIKEYLKLKSREANQWRIDVQLPDQHVKLLQSRRNILSIGGGNDPWTGQQSFNLQIRQPSPTNTAPTVTVAIAAQIDVPPMIVVAAGPLRRDQIVTGEMLAYAPLPLDANESEFFVDVQSLIGKQLRRSVSTQQAISTDFVGEPTVMQRNELIEVESISGSVVVKTSAKSLGSGAIGDLIEIELPDRKKIKAVIIGSGQVRIAAASKVASGY